MPGKSQRRKEKKSAKNNSKASDRGLRGSPVPTSESSSSQSRGERKKSSLYESPTPIEQGGDYP